MIDQVTIAALSLAGAVGFFAGYAIAWRQRGRQLVILTPEDPLDLEALVRRAQQ